MKRNSLPLLLAASLAVISCAQSQAQSDEPEFAEGRIWFKLKDEAAAMMPGSGTGKRSLLHLVPEELSVRYEVTEVIMPFPLIPSPALQLTCEVRFRPGVAAGDLAEELSRLPYVEYAERVPLNRTFLVPDDTDYDSLWYMPQVQAEEAWDVAMGSAAVVVAIVDNAVQTGHTDLAANIWVNPGEVPGNGLDDDGNGYTDDVSGYDVSDGDNNPNPVSTGFFHGTMVAGCAGAATNNGTGVASIGSGISIMAVKVTRDAAADPMIIGDGYEGVQYAMAAGAHVINMSWGSYTFSQTAQNIMTAAHAQGIVLVAAAGNSGGAVAYPAAYDHVIAVAGYRKQGQKVTTSNYGPEIDISSPGARIYSTTTYDGYATMNGTSLASPITAGLCGLILSARSGMTPDEVADCLASAADPLSNDSLYNIGLMGAGSINAFNAVQCALGTSVGPEKDKTYGAIRAFTTGEGTISIEFDLHTEQNLVIAVSNQLGQIVFRKRLVVNGSQSETLELRQPAPGIYFLTVQGSGIYFVHKLLRR